MSQKLTVFVTGATGGQGSAVTCSLLSAGHSVHALVRDPTTPSALALSRAGAFLFTGTFSSIPSLEAAARGCSTLLLPSITNPNELLHAQNIITASLKAGITHCVATTATSAESFSSFKSLESNKNDWAVKYWETKKAVQDLVIASFEKWTILQPAWLMSCFVDPLAGFLWEGLKTERVLVNSFGKGTKIEVCGYDVIGSFALAAFEEGKMDGKIIMLANERLDIEEIAKTMGELAGVDVGVRYRSDEEVERLKGANPLVATQVWQRIDGTGADVEEVRKWGIEGMGFREFLVENKDNLNSALGLGS